MVGQAHDVRVHDAFGAVQHDAQPHTVQGVGPRDLRLQADGVAVAVRETEPEKQPAGRLETGRGDELPPEHTKRLGAHQEDALRVEPDDAFVGPELDQVREPEL